MVQMWLDQRFQLIDALAHTLEDLYLTQGQDPRPILKMTMAAGNFFDVDLGLFNGTMIDGANWRAPADYDPRTRPWYRRAMEEQKLTLTRPFMDAGFWKMVIAVVVPLVHNNQMAGVMKILGVLFDIKGFIIVVLGGLGSIPGVIIGGIIIGIIESVGPQFMTATWTEAIVYGLFLLVLFVKPSGLFGVKYDW